MIIVKRLRFLKEHGVEFKSSYAFFQYANVLSTHFLDHDEFCVFWCRDDGVVGEMIFHSRNYENAKNTIRLYKNVTWGDMMDHERKKVYLMNSVFLQNKKYLDFCKEMDDDV